MGIFEILAKRNGSIPRRIVLLSQDDIGEKAEFPHIPECHVLSSIGECIALEKGLPVYSRDPVTLISQCLEHDLLCEHAWLALCDDIDCDLVTMEHIDAAFELYPQRATGFYTAILGSPSITHAVCVIRVLAHCLQQMPDDAKDHLVAILCHDVRGGASFFEKVIRLLKTLPSGEGMREKAYAAFGKTLFVDDGVAKEVAAQLAQHDFSDDVIRLFLASPCNVRDAFGDTRVDMLQRLAKYIPTLPVPRRGPLFEFAARLSDRDVLDCQLKDVWTRLIHHALKDPLQAPSALLMLRSLEPPDTLLGLVLQRM